MKKLIVTAVVVLALIAVAAIVGVRLMLNPERVRAAVESQASAALGLPVSIGSADVQVWPRAGLTVVDVTVGAPPQVTLARAQVSTGLRGLLSRRVEDAEVLVEDSRLDLLKLLAALDGLASSGGTSTPTGGEAAEPPALEILSIRTIGLRNVELVVGDRQANVTLESALVGDRLEIHRLSATAAETTLEATGTVESIARRVARLKIEADPLDLDGLMQFASAFSQAPSSGTAQSAEAGAPALDLRADVQAKSGRVAGLTFRDLQTTLAVTPGTVTLSPLTFGALDGRFEGVVSLALVEPQPELAIAGTASAVSLQQLATFASGEPSTMTGTLDAKMKLRGRGLDPDSAIKTATGSADVLLQKGQIPGLQLVRPAVLAFGRPQGAPPEGSGEAFERIATTITVERGRMQTDNLVFESRDVDMAGTGSLGMTGGALDVTANLMLSEELSAQAGRDLVRYTREGNRVVLPAVVSGTVSSPQVMIDTGQALRRAVTNEIKERASDVFKRLMPGAKKPPKQ